jgi:sialic acid synthase SpsE
MTTIKIGNRLVGEDQPCFIIAEAGVNHNGELDLAKKLVDVAVEAGVDAVKFQVLTAKGLYVKNAGTFTTDWGEEHDIYEVWKKVEVPDSWIPELAEYCKSKNIIFFLSVFDEKVVDSLNNHLGLYKVASSETTHIPLLKKIAKTGKPVIFSIGGAEMSEVEEAVSSISEEGNNNIAVMQCVAQYPMPLDQANVNVVSTLKQRFPNVVVGYSDHSMDPVTVPVAAVVKGAKMIEKHFTLSREMEGIDHKMSLEPHELKQMVGAIRDAEYRLKQGENLESKINPSVLGDGEVKLTEEQRGLLSFVRRKIFAVKDVKAGETFTVDNIVALRPGNRDSTGGLHPREYFNLLGKKAKMNLPALALVKEEHLE